MSDRPDVSEYFTKEKDPGGPWPGTVIIILGIIVITWILVGP